MTTCAGGIPGLDLLMKRGLLARLPAGKYYVEKRLQKNVQGA
jgi:hypothetical protein